jgi:hypothetical protein
MSAGSANTDALFDRELKKYDTLKADVAANVGRNEELLAAISRDAQVWQQHPFYASSDLLMFLLSSHQQICTGTATASLLHIKQPFCFMLFSHQQICTGTVTASLLHIKQPFCFMLSSHQQRCTGAATASLPRIKQSLSYHPSTIALALSPQLNPLSQVVLLLNRCACVQAFKAVFEVPAWRAACEGAAGGIKAVLKTYKEVLDHLSEGLRFYMSLQVRRHTAQRGMGEMFHVVNHSCILSEGLRFYMSLQVGHVFCSSSAT